MVVHNYPSSKHNNKHFLVKYWNMLISDSSFATAGGSSPSGRPLNLSTKSVASTLKCFSLQHICPKWSLIAHWRMHDIKCLQTWNNHVLSPLEIVCSGICIYHHVEQNQSFSSRIGKQRAPFSFDHARCICVRDHVHFLSTPVSVTVCFMKTLECFPHARCRNAQKSVLTATRRRAEGFLKSS